MTPDDLLQALRLPPDALLRQRIAKKLLLEHAPLPAPERRLLHDALYELQLLATLKPELCGVPAYAGTPADANDPEVAELLVLGVRLRPAPTAWPRLLDTLHRAFPYPLLLLAEAADAPAGTVLSLARKRRAQNDAVRLTLLETRHTPPLLASAGDVPAAFAGSLGLGAVPVPHLHALYQRYLDGAVALEAAWLTGHYALPTAAHATRLRADLARYAALSQEMAELRRQASRTTQLPQRVAHNLRLRELQTELDAVLLRLTPG
jgi:hypothetical protein